MGRATRLLLISDLHLEEARPELTEAFLRFLVDDTRSASALYILGDFFNLWIGDDDDRPLNALISEALHAEAERGLTIYLMHGNRDFLLGDAFAEASGARLLTAPHLLKHGGRRYLLTHGDELCTRDVDYQEFRLQVRSPSWQAAFLARPLGERRAYADQARARSKTMSSNKPVDIMDVTESEVMALMARHQCQSLIHGHTHRPAHHHFALGEQRAERLVLGDWGHEGWYIDLTDGPVLKRFPITP